MNLQGGAQQSIFNSNRVICMVRPFGERLIQQKRPTGLESNDLIRYVTSLMVVMVYFSIYREKGEMDYNNICDFSLSQRLQRSNQMTRVRFLRLFRNIDRRG